MSLGAFGSVSAKGLMSFGSVTVASNLHQETYAEPEQGHDLDLLGTYPFVLDMGILDLEPARSHDFALQNKEFKCASIGSKYSRERWTRYIRWDLGFWK